MKKFAEILMIIPVMLFTSSCNAPIYGEPIAETKGIKVFDTDYIKKYKSTFDAMFDNAW